MNFTQSFKLAIKSLLLSKMRALLTMLGIIIGVAAVIIITSLGNGMQNYMNAQFEQLGSNLIQVMVYGRGEGGTRDVSTEDMYALVEKYPQYLSGVTPYVSATAKVRQGTEDFDRTSIYGVSEAFYRADTQKTMQGSSLENGRFLRYIDVERHQNVCVIGSYLAENAFRTDPLGQTISVSGVPYMVVGVLAESGDSTEGSVDDVIYIPYANAQRLGGGYGDMYLMTSTDRDTASAAKGIIENRLFKTYQSSDYYMVMTSAEMMDAMDSMLNTLMMILILIAAISLLVGGIGIMNIMLVSVTERTREIGIRKSLGAKERYIMEQFVIEAACTSALGGVIGRHYLRHRRCHRHLTGHPHGQRADQCHRSGAGHRQRRLRGYAHGWRHRCGLRRLRGGGHPVRLSPRQQGGQAEPHRRPALRLIPADEKRDRETGLFFAQKIFQKIVLPPNFFRSRRVYTAERTERTMRNVSHILEKQLTDYLVTDQARFYRLAYSYLKNREEALDAVQTAVCRALEKQGELKEPEALRAWFYHILVHVCMDVLRSRKRVTLIPPEALDAGSYEDPLPSDGTLAQRVDALPPEVGTIIKLRFYEDLSLKEISTVTGWNLNTVKTRLYTGLKKLRISMEGDQL